MYLLTGYFPNGDWWAITLCLFGGMLLSDFLSGFLHFFFDTFGTVDMPIFGNLVIRDFRIHHHEPRKMLAHNFIEASGSINAASVPVFATWLYFFAESNPWLTVLMFGAGIVSTFTNEFHKLAHDPDPPKWAVWCQKMWLILPPEHHGIHHTYPHKHAYCITFGWMNPILDKMRFFHTIEWLGQRWVDNEQRA